MATKKTTTDPQEEQVQEQVSNFETFYLKNRKLIWGIVGGAAVVALLVLAYSQFIAKPKKAEAAAQMYPAEAAFARGEFEVALNGDGNILGFVDVIDEYKGYAPKAAKFYAGVSELQLGNYEEALGYLKGYKGHDDILAARALACQGDALVGLDDLKGAVAAFDKAASRADNMFAAEYLLKEGVALEALGETDKALKLYKTIKDKYPQSIEGYDIDKYIARIEATK